MRTPPEGRLVLTIAAPGGGIVAVRFAKNLVLKKGAELVAGLFSGKSNTPVNFLRIGFGKDVVNALATELTAPAAPIAAANLQAALKPEHFEVVSGDTSVTVKISAPFEPKVDIADVSEAGLFAGDILYNQVVFEPVAMNKDQVITFFWQVDFPFGR